MNVNLDALSDVTKINISQVGYSTSEFMLERQLLMNEKSYCGTVSKFDIDLGNTHMLTTNPLNYKILEIKRRDVGQDIAATDLTLVNTNVTNQAAQTFLINYQTQGIVNSPGEYTRLLNRFFHTFDELHRKTYDVNGAVTDAVVAAQHSNQNNDLGQVT